MTGLEQSLKRRMSQGNSFQFLRMKDLLRYFAWDGYFGMTLSYVGVLASLSSGRGVGFQS